MDENRLVRANKNDNSIKIMIAVIAVLSLLIVGLALYLLVFSKNSNNTQNNSEPASVNDDSGEGPASYADISDTESDDESVTDESPEPYSGESQDDPSYVDESSPAESSVEESSGEYVEPEHGWVINYLGYTYLYKGYGFEQFTFSSNIVNKYTDSLNKIKQLAGSKRVYNILVPTNCEFFTIPASVKQEDDFYCASQRKFMNNVYAKTDSSIINVDVYNTFETHYDEKLFFNSDPNYTHLAAYYVYLDYCKAAGITPIVAGMYTQKLLNNQFLGKFFTATGSERVMKNADRFDYFDIDEAYTATEKVYRGSGIVNRTGVIFADTGSYNYYTFLGEDAKRIDITAAGDASRSLLVIGDSSAAPFITFLVPNYGKITYINPQLYNDSIADMLAGDGFTDVVIITYNTYAGRLLHSDLAKLAGN